MEVGKLQHLLTEDEGFKLDFKLKLSLEYESEKKELAKDVIAIANTEGGRGYIIFGVEDKSKKIIGIEGIQENTEERIQQIIASRSMPPVAISFEVVKIEDKSVGVLTIFKSKQLPHQMTQNGAFYIRRGSTTDSATRYEVAKMLQYSGLLHFETAPCRGAKMSDLDFQHMEKLLPYSVTQGKENIDLLIALGIIVEKDQGKGYYPTYGGLLLFGKNPQVFIPQAILEIWIKEKPMRIKGNIMRQLDIFKEKVKPIFPTTYPFESLYEVVVNALVHRDYWNNQYSTYVSINEKEVYVQNPSCYSYIENEKKTIRMNGWLYSRLLLLEQKNGERNFGIGLEKAIQLFENKQGVHIHYYKEIGLFRVILPSVEGLKEAPK